MDAAYNHSRFIKLKAAELGFSYCGISKAEFLEAEAPRVEEWLKRGYQGRMKYLENHFDKRLDPTLLVPGAKSVVSLVYSYYPKEDLSRTADLKVAKYAFGEDYHVVIREKLTSLLEAMRDEIGQINGRVFVDSAPVMERAWAQRSGAGWIGKNSLLLNRGMGSFFFLAEIIVDLALTYDTPTGDYCGTCTACMDACPTDAIAEPFVVDGSRCISYFTIELKDNIPSTYKDKFENWIFGCDICQDVCPWNRFAAPHNERRFEPDPAFSTMTRSDWEDLSEEIFNKVFARSPLTRAGFEGIKRNVNFLTTEIPPPVRKE
jgi:epoxyqueuosine reductase